MAIPGISGGTLALLLNAGGYVVTNVLSWFGGQWKERSNQKSKQGNMQRHLYKELSSNYAILYDALESHVGLMRLMAGGISGFPVEVAYRNHALKDFDTYHSLVEYTFIESAYDGLITARVVKGDDLPEYLRKWMSTINWGLVEGYIDRKLFLKESSKPMRPLVREEIQKRAMELGKLGRSQRVLRTLLRFVPGRK